MNRPEADESKLGYPSKTEVLDQLERMLASQCLKGKDQEKRVLRYLVVAKIRRNKITEADIREDLFPSPPYIAMSTMGRYTVAQLRRSIEEYNNGPGKVDVVTISLPKPKEKGRRGPIGESYETKTSYNPQNSINKLYAMGLHHTAGRCVGSLMEGCAYFGKVIKANGDHAGARIGYAEIMLKFFLINGDASEIESVIDFMRETVDLDEDNWWGRVVFGVALLVGRRVGQARTEFSIALRLRTDLVQGNAWYHFFLLATRDASEAESVARSAFERDNLNIWAGVMYCATAYLRGDGQSAIERWREFLYLEFNFWTAPFLEALLWIGPDSSGGDKQLAEAERLFGVSNGEYFGGIRSIIAQAENGVGRAEIMRVCREKAEESQQWFNLALCGIAESDELLAKESLEKAWHAYDPRMLLMHLWPFFEPLRKYDWFKSLNEKRLVKPPISTISRTRRIGER